MRFRRGGRGERREIRKKREAKGAAYKTVIYECASSVVSGRTAALIAPRTEQSNRLAEIKP